MGEKFNILYWNINYKEGSAGKNYAFEDYRGENDSILKKFSSTLIKCFCNTG